MSDRRPFLVADVADALGVSATRVKDFDAQLSPERTPRGVRVYRADAVERFAAGRNARRNGGSR